MSSIEKNQRIIPRKAKYRVRNSQGDYEIVYFETSADQVETDAQRQFVTEAEKLQLNENTIFTNDKPIVRPIGGIAVGTVFDKTPVKDVLSQLICPYVAPEVTLECVPPAGVYEKGQGQTLTKLIANIEKKTDKITKVEFLDGPVVLHVREDAVIADGGIVEADLNLIIDSDKNFQVRVTDESGTVNTYDSGLFKFVYPYYMGVVADGADVDEVQIKKLFKKIEDKGDKSYPYISVFERLAFAYPKAYGELKEIIDFHQSNITNIFDRHEVEVTGLDATPQTYFIYICHPCTVTNFMTKFNY